MQLLIGSNNPGKVEQILQSLSGLPYTCITPKELGISDDVEETGSSYTENAYIKAKFYFEKTQLPTITDDSGLEVTALPNILGVHSRRLDGKTPLNDEEWVEKFLELMTHKEDRSARFVSTVCFIQCESKDPQYFHGAVEGTITHAIMYPYKAGLPASSLFIPNGENRTFSQLEKESRDFLNHRKKSMIALREHLESQNFLY